MPFLCQKACLSKSVYSKMRSPGTYQIALAFNVKIVQKAGSWMRPFVVDFAFCMHFYIYTYMPMPETAYLYYLILGLARFFNLIA